MKALVSRGFLGIAASFLVVAVPPPQVMAQGQVEEIIVTARQRKELLQDVPATITAFTEADIRRSGIERAEDFIFQTPGVSLVDAAEVGDSQVNIRGINGARDGESSFAFIVDGVLLTNPSAFNREFADLQQIEILKGPQGALYGRSAASGAMIFTTKKPGNEFEGSMKASVGNEQSYYVSAVASGPLLKDQLFGRVHVDFRTTDGFYKNAFLGADDVVDDFENWNINGRLLWEPNGRLSVDTKLRYGEVDAAAITFNAAFNLADIGAFPGFGLFFEDVNEHQFIFQPNIDPQNEQEATEFSIKVDYEMDWATATAWFLYSDIQNFFLADGTSADFGFFGANAVFPGPAPAAEPDCLASFAAVSAAGVSLPPPLGLGAGPGLLGGTIFGPYSPTTCDGFQYQQRDQEDISFELRLTSPSDQRLRWVGGLYYLDIDREVGVNLGIDNSFSGRPPRAQLYVPGNTEALVDDQFKSEVWSVFGQLAYDFTADIEAAFALRYDREDRDVKNLVPVNAVTQFVDYTAPPFIGPFAGGSPLNPALVDLDVLAATGTITTLGGIPDRNEVFEQWQPKISVTWDATDTLTLFASYGVGFKSGGFNNLGSAATIDLFFNTALGSGLSVGDTFKKEVSDAFEVGFKSRFADGRVRVDGALFHTMVEDMQYFEFYVGTFGLLRVVTNIDEVSITGGELSVNAAVTDSLSVYGGLSVVNGIIDKNSNRPITKGNKVPYTPDYTLVLGANYVKPAYSAIDFVAHIDYSLVGETWFHTLQEGDRVPNLFTPLGFGRTGLDRAKRDTFDQINVRVGFEGDKWGVNLFVKNLMDEAYLEEVISAPEFGGSFIHPGARRAWGLEAVYQF
jgi:iron complex outermembrane receptor protein